MECSSSPFLLNATINHHTETYRPVDPYLVDKFLSSIYVDDLVSGSLDVNSSAFEFYKKSRQRLAVAGFRSQKFITNSEELRHLIYLNESQSEGGGVEDVTHVEEYLSYAKGTLGVEDGWPAAKSTQDSQHPVECHQ